MTNDEIRTKIAKLRGVEYEVIHFVVGDELCIKDDDDAYMPIPNWPVDIAAAWELVEEWRNAGEVDSIVYKKADVSERFINSVLLRHSFIYVEEFTTPLAICLAYIQFKESQK